VWDGSSCLACASGWELMNYGTPRCVKAFTDTRTGSSAASYCNTFPTGRLVTILNSNENNFIKNMISGHSWIGLADATEIEQTAALVNVGSSYSSSANPYWFGAYGGQIKGNTVSNNNYFKLTTNEAKMYSFALYGLSTDLDLFLYASDCSTLLKSWIESGSELGSYNLAAGTTYCIKVGYNNNSGPYILAVNYSSEDDQYFSWLSGSLYNYHNWNSGEPNNYDEYCTQLYTTGFWNDLDCSDSLQYVCERNPGS
ncbi:MAG TPA: lectin-like protein, partial [bacterium]|nr:lectin-like protein [bacterium]